MKSLTWIVHSCYLNILTVSLSCHFDSFFFTVCREKDVGNEKLRHHEFLETGRDHLEHRLGPGSLFLYGYDETCVVL